MKRIMVFVVFLSVVASQLNCATVINGTTQKIGMSSSPTGAHVIIDNQPRGETPLFANL